MIRACLLLFICSAMNHSGSDKHYSTAMQITSRGVVTHTHTRYTAEQIDLGSTEAEKHLTCSLLALSHTKTCARLFTICTHTHNPPQITFFPTLSHCLGSCFHTFDDFRVPLKHKQAILTKLVSCLLCSFWESQT